MTGSDQYGAIPVYYTLDDEGNPLFRRSALRAADRATCFAQRRHADLGYVAVQEYSAWERTRRAIIQLRLEAFNAFNHPNFQDKNYGANVTGPWAYASPTDPLTITQECKLGNVFGYLWHRTGRISRSPAWGQDLLLRFIGIFQDVRLAALI